LGFVTDKPMGIDDATPIKTSFPNFISLMRGIGARIEADSGEPGGAATLTLEEDL
jgi:hypothetical protein